MKTKEIILVFILLAATMGFTAVLYTCADKHTEETTVEVRLEEPSFLLNDIPTAEIVWKAINHYKLEYPNIVYAQAVLETGHFRSLTCLNYNNLFGLYDSKKQDYYKFDHWSESILFYKKNIESKYEKDENYFTFLRRINYAPDDEYIRNLINIVTQIFL